MAVTSYKACATAARDASIGTTAWNNNENTGAPDGPEVSANDNDYAKNSPTSGGTTNYLKCTMGSNAFTTSDIPSGATIDGFEIEVTRFRNGNPTVNTNYIKLVKGGTIVGNDFGNTTDWANGSETAYTLGSSTQKGGQSWTDAEARATDFGCVIAALVNTNRTMPNPHLQIEMVRIRVYYTVTSGDVTVTPGLIGDASGALNAPSVSLGVGISPSVMTANGATQTPQVNFGATMTPATLTASANTATPTVVTDQVLAQSVIGTGSGALPTPSVAIGALVLPAIVGTVTNEGKEDPEPSTGSTISAGVVGTAAGALPAPTIAFDMVVPVALVGNADGALPAPTVGIGSTIAPALVGTVSGDVGAPTIATGSTVAPSVLAGSCQSYAPTITLGMVVTPPVLAGSCQAYTPTFYNGSVLFEAGVVGTVVGQLFAPTVGGGALIQPLLVGNVLNSFETPSVITDHVVAVGLFGNAQGALPEPNITIDGGVSVDPPQVGHAVGDLLTPDLQFGYVFEAPVLAATAQLLAPTQKHGSTMAVGVIGTAVGAFQAPIASAGANIPAPLLAGTASMGAHTPSTGVNYPAPVLGAQGAMDAPTVLTNDGTTVLAPVMAGSCAMLAPSPVISVAVQMSAPFGCTAVFYTPSVVLASLITPSTFAATGNLLTPAYVGQDQTFNYWWFRQYVIGKRRQ